jgi:hypothetical protein
MRESVTARLDQLRHEYEIGQAQLRELVEREAALRETLVRISGAILVLEELLDAGSVESVDAGEQQAGAQLSVP